MRSRERQWETRIRIVAVLASLILVANLSAAKEMPGVLFVGDSDNHVASGLRALQIPFHQASLNELVQGNVCLFDYSVLAFGMDVRRTGLESMKDAMTAFVEVGGVVLCFRSSEADPWLPVALERDRAYALGEVLVRDHPVFNKPHRFDRAALQSVHGGSIYTGFYDLGEGWRPLLAAGKQQAWDKTPSQYSGEHYGIVELELGKGRIVLCQMIPAYAWFHDAKGEADTPGARFFENFVRYAIASAIQRETPRKPRVQPEEYAADLNEIMKAPSGWDRLRLDDPDWHFTAKGPFTGACDRRGVYTISYGKEATQAGNFGQLSRRVQIPQGASRVMLRVYQSDDYCGGREPKMVGDARVSTSINRKEAYRFRQVLIDDQVVVEADVLGRNVQPARERIQWYDVTELVRGKQEVALALKVVDRKGTDGETFPTDCFFACIDLRSDYVRVDAEELAAQGYAEDARGMALTTEQGLLSLASPVPNGRYVVAFRILDHPYGQGAARISVNGRPAVTVRASADDYRFWWLTTPPLSIEEGAEIVLQAKRDGEEQMVFSDVAFVPADLCETETETVATQSPIFNPRQPASHEIVKLEVPETVGVARNAEITSQAVPFAMGRLRSPQHITVKTTDAKAVPTQVRPFA